MKNTLPWRSTQAQYKPISEIEKLLNATNNYL